MNNLLSILRPYLKEGAPVEINEQGLPACKVPYYTEGMRANIAFLANPNWRQYYFESHHRSETFRSRWAAVTGCWNNKIVVDIGCGPGNVFATIGGSPRTLIGIDISVDSLLSAQKLGYVPLLADAHNIPLADACADIVVMNATLHHCDDMVGVLREGARLVKAGGVLLCDQDPQKSAWAFNRFGLWIRQLRFPLYRVMRSRYYRPVQQRRAREATEIHNRFPGDGISKEIYEEALSDLGMDFMLYPHNHDLGREVLHGSFGKGSWRYRLSQRLSGINPNSAEAAQSVMGVVTHRCPSKHENSLCLMSESHKRSAIDS